MLSSSSRLRLLTQRFPWFHARRLSVNAEEKATEKSSNEEILRASGPHPVERPKVPKHRDPHAVLKALSSTVSQLDHSLDMGRSKADPLAPRHRNDMVMYSMAMEAGRKAAKSVIHSRPKLFPARKPVPDLLTLATEDVLKEGTQKVSKGRHEDYLIGFLDKKKTNKALVKYKELQRKGKHVSLESQNRLLTLLCFYGMMNKYEPVPETSTSGAAEHSSVGEEEDGAVREGTFLLLGDKEPTKRKVPFSKTYKVWNDQNPAENMFAEMKEKDGLTYSAMIIGLVKHKSYHRAFVMFDEARKQNLQLDLPAYNALLHVLADSVVSNPWPKAKVVVGEMQKDPVVEPDLKTMGNLLAIAEFSGNAAEDHALEITREMFHLGLKPNLSTFVKLLMTFVRNGEPFILYPIVDYIEAHREILTLTSPLDIYFFVVAMRACKINIKDPHLAKRLKVLADLDNWALVDNISMLINDYVCILAEAGLLSECKEVYQKSVPIYFKPMDWLVKVLLKMCEKNKDADFALYLWNDLIKWTNIVRDVSVIHGFMAGIISRPNPERYKDYIRGVQQAWRNMETNNLMPNEFIIAASIKMYCLDGNVEQAWYYYEQYKEYNMRPTFLALSSLLKLAARNWDTPGVEKILNEMVKQRYFLPIAFVKDICVQVQMPQATSTAFIENMQRIGLEMKLGGPAVRDTGRYHAQRPSQTHND